MKKLFVLFFSVFIFTTSSADTSKIKNNIFNSIENFLNDNFDDTEFSFKSKNGIKPEIGILTFKPLKDTDDEISFFSGFFFYT